MKSVNFTWIWRYQREGIEPPPPNTPFTYDTDDYSPAAAAAAPCRFQLPPKTTGHLPAGTPPSRREIRSLRPRIAADPQQCASYCCFDRTVKRISGRASRVDQRAEPFRRFSFRRSVLRGRGEKNHDKNHSLTNRGQSSTPPPPRVYVLCDPQYINYSSSRSFSFWNPFTIDDRIVVVCCTVDF